MKFPSPELSATTAKTTMILNYETIYLTTPELLTPYIQTHTRVLFNTHPFFWHTRAHTDQHYAHTHIWYTPVTRTLAHNIHSSHKAETRRERGEKTGERGWDRWGSGGDNRRRRDWGERAANQRAAATGTVAGEREMRGRDARAREREQREVSECERDYSCCNKIFIITKSTKFWDT